MSRLLSTIASDIRYQWRYGFYLIYALLTVCFIVVLRLIPDSWRQAGLAVILLSDPALLGFIFIGGILQLERGERILDALFSAPLRPVEYIAAKGVSLGIISTLVGSIIALGSGAASINYALLVPAMFVSSACFTFIGISVSVNLKSMNAFLSVDSLWELILLLPPLLILLGVCFPLLDVFPGSITLRMIHISTGLSGSFLWAFIGLCLWTVAAFLLAIKRLESALNKIGGGGS